MATITREMFEATYKAAQSVYTGTAKKSDAAKNVIKNTGMNPSSAKGYIEKMISILNGKPYIRTIKKDAVDYFLDRIHKDYGIDKFGNALHSVREHLEAHFKKYGKRQKDVGDVLDSYEKKILPITKKNILPIAKF